VDLVRDFRSQVQRRNTSCISEYCVTAGYMRHAQESLRDSKHIHCYGRDAPAWSHGIKYTNGVMSWLTYLDKGNAFGNEDELLDDDGIEFSVKYLEKISCLPTTVPSMPLIPCTDTLKILREIEEIST